MEPLWSLVLFYSIVTQFLDVDYEYFNETYLKAKEAGFDNATCCPAIPLDMYQRLTPLTPLDGPEEMSWAIGVAGTIWFFWIFLVTAPVLWHSAIWSLELIMFW